MKFMKQNAIKNEQKGLKVEDVAKFIYKISNKQHPKSSYTIGADAKFAQIISYLPQDIINFIVKSALKLRVTKSQK